MTPERPDSQDILRRRLAALDAGAPAPDGEFLRQLREQSLRVFQDVNDSSAQPSVALKNHQPLSTAVGPPLLAGPQLKPADPQDRKPPMMTFALRGLIALVASAAALVLAFITTEDVPASPSLGTLLRNMEQAKSLHLQLYVNEERSEVWVKSGDRLRQQQTPDRYQIVRGSQLYQVNEAENRYTQSPSPYADISLAELLQLPELQDAGAVLDSQPVERKRVNGVMCEIYETELETRKYGTVQLTAVASANAGILQTLQATMLENGVEKTVGEMQLLAFNPPVAPELFVLNQSLTEDGRLGIISDSQGLVTIRPVGQHRWTPITREMLVRPGDWVRTDIRGANAVQLKLVNGTEIVLGPGSLLELSRLNELRLFSGEARLKPGKDVTLKLSGPTDQAQISKAGVYRVEKDKLAVLAKDPLWLAGFQGVTTQESLGSLIALVDGKNVPLTIGYHKVIVEVRDQIARTTIEESFVNHTDARTEGQFYFPLPQDASISSFGMWIGNELVEADVVEKQRAREIYEEILREKRDPGLLEWTGGNIFKARVFPIEARSEKRVKITYTQVLPLKGNRYTYSYALQSELLKQTPLRELDINVQVYSALPLQAVNCPTHPVRQQQTEHSAQVTFSAQEYRPERDFEVSFELAGGQQDVVVIPHRRGADGYFLLQLMPPSGAGQWQREVIPDGDPLHLLLLADTSASMSESDRRTQGDFVAAMLASLSPEDTFNLGTCDVTTQWVFPKAQPATEEHIQQARKYLDDRDSLGWSDLDLAFGDVTKQAGKKTNVVYVGDGIVTAKAGTPEEFVARLKNLYGNNDGTFHAVTVGNAYESVVLKAIAALGSGSTRHIGGEATPAAITKDLLAEITRPGLKDINVEFRGLKVARVYPEVLPNIPAGSQQIIIGRYLPEGKDQTGEVVVTGTLGGEKVTYKATVQLADAESGNSFIPRLWARSYLDSLLAQGSNAAIQQEIIALSEEYHIITPYTSLLVLETDADRERFGVKRRFQMRDGEKFFAEGRDHANFELRQQQMKLAGTWRLQLQQQILAQLSTLGRNPQALQLPQPLQELKRLEDEKELGGVPLSLSDVRLASPEDSTRLNAEFDYLQDQTLGGLGNARNLQSWEALGDVQAGQEAFLGTYLGRQPERSNGRYREEPTPSETPAFNMPATASPALPMIYNPEGKPQWGINKDSGLEMFKKLPQGGEWYGEYAGDELLVTDEAVRLQAGGRYFSMDGADLALGVQVDGLYRRKRSIYDGEYSGWRQQPDTLFWLREVLPMLSAKPAPRKAEPVKSDWPAEIVKQVAPLHRLPALRKIQGGLEITRNSVSRDIRRNRVTEERAERTLWSADRWLTHPVNQPQQQVQLEWCTKTERGIINRSHGIGRTRESAAVELESFPGSLSDFSDSPLEEQYRNYTPSVQPAGENRIELTLTYKHNKQSQVRFLIDTARNVVLKQEQIEKGKVTSTYLLEEFVEVAGMWWATSVKTLNQDGAVNHHLTRQVTAVTAEQFAELFQTELKSRETSVMLPQPLPELKAAQQAQLDGKAGSDELFTLCLHFSLSQQWEKVRESFAKLQQLHQNKRAMHWLHLGLLRAERRNEEARLGYLDAARKLVEEKPVTELYLANFIVAGLNSVASTSEQLELNELLKPIYERQPEWHQSKKYWMSRQAGLLSSLGRQNEELALRKELVTLYREDTYLHREYTQVLVSMGEYDAAYAWLDQLLNDQAMKWTDWEDRTLRETYAGYLENQASYVRLEEFLRDWIKRNPTGQDPYRRLIAVLIRNDKLDEMRQLVHQWFTEGRVEGELPEAVKDRLYAAIYFALGEGWHFSTYRVQEEFVDELVKTARHFMQSEQHLDIAHWLINASRLTQHEVVRQLRQETMDLLRKDLSEMPLTRLEYYVYWIQHNDPEVPQDLWKHIADSLRKRWDAEKDVGLRHAIAQQLIRVLPYRTDKAELLAFYRVQIEQATPEYRVQYLRQLFDHLHGQEWTQEREDELYKLLTQLTDAKEEVERLADILPSLYALNDSMLQKRIDQARGQIKEPEKINPQDLEKQYREIDKAAREAISARMQQAAADSKGTLLADWYLAEHLYLEVRLERNTPAVVEWAKKRLGETPVVIDVEAEKKPQEHLRDYYQAVLRTRAFVTLAHLSVQKNADRQLADWLLAYVAKGTALEPAEQQLPWKQRLHSLLIALDRPAELETHLRKWLQADKITAPWRLSLANLVAERGQIPEAVQLYEAIEKDQSLGPQQYMTLANWYLVLDQRQQYERAMIQVYMAMQEYQIQNYLNNRRYQFQQDPTTQLDEDLLLMFRALFAKSTYPQNYTYELQEMYRITQDFRLLEFLPDALLGQTAGKVYAFLNGLQTVLNEIRSEAPADELLARLQVARQAAKSEVDKRALHLLELLVERRAAEIQNQPGPHVEKAVQALLAAEKEQWTDGEPELMVDFLANLGHLTQPRLAQEQLRIARELHAASQAGSTTRLNMAADVARIQWTKGDRQAAADFLSTALDEYSAAINRPWPSDVNEPLGQYVSYLTELKQFAKAEQLLQKHLQQPANGSQKQWLTSQLDELYLSAYRNQGLVSLGSGDALFQKLLERFVKTFQEANENESYNACYRITNLLQEGKRLNAAMLAAVTKKFVFEQAPAKLQTATNNYHSMVSHVAGVATDVLGHPEGIRFLLDRLDNDPKRFQYMGTDSWQQFAHSLSYWRYYQEVDRKQKLDGELSQRLLNRVLAELRKDLNNRGFRENSFTHEDNSYFWKEKEADFLRVAEAVFQEQAKNEAYISFVATFVYNHLKNYDRGIEILLAAHGQKLLSESGQSQLVIYLHERQRWGESLVVLEPLQQKYPDNLEYRLRLMRAYFHTKQPQRLKALLEETDKRMHDTDRWVEPVIIQLADVTRETELYAQSVEYYQAGIHLRKKASGNGGSGDGVLSEYFRHQAEAYAGLGDTALAVDAAAAAIVSWGPRHEERKIAIETLVRVLERSSNLDGFVAHWNEKQDDSSIIRKSIGRVYQDRSKFAEAAAQFQLALELDPADAELYPLLIEAFDKGGKQEDATRVLYAQARWETRNLDLYKSLGDRLKGDAQRQERAYTSIVEMRPTEAEGHAGLAKVRQEQNRWDEAIGHWQKVAEFRSKEPDGLLALAEAQIHQRQWQAARASVNKLLETAWPPRFTDTREQAAKMLQQIQEGEKKSKM